MSSYDDNKVDDLLSFLDSSEWWDWLDWETENEYINAITALGEIGDKKAVKPLINLLQSVDKDYGYEILNAIMNSLVQLKDESAIPFLVKGFDGYVDGPNMIFSNALVKFGPASFPYLEDALFSKIGNVRFAAATTLQNLNWGPPSDKYRAAYLCAIGNWMDATKYGHSASKPLILILSDREYIDYLSVGPKYRNKEEIKVELITCVGNTGDPEVIQKLGPYTCNPTPPEMKLAAIKALGELGKSLLKYRTVEEPLIHNDEVLSKYSTDINQSIIHLIGVFRGIEEEERVAAISSIISFERLAIPNLAFAISDRDVMVRRYVVKTLDKLIDLQAKILLIRSTKDEDYEVRYLSLNALEKYLKEFPCEKILKEIENGDPEEKEYRSAVIEMVRNNNYSSILREPSDGVI